MIKSPNDGGAAVTKNISSVELLKKPGSRRAKLTATDFSLYFEAYDSEYSEKEEQ